MYSHTLCAEKCRVKMPEFSLLSSVSQETFYIFDLSQEPGQGRGKVLIHLYNMAFAYNSARSGLRRAILFLLQLNSSK